MRIWNSSDSSQRVVWTLEPGSVPSPPTSSRAPAAAAAATNRFSPSWLAAGGTRSTAEALPTVSPPSSIRVQSKGEVKVHIVRVEAGLGPPRAHFVTQFSVTFCSTDTVSHLRRQIVASGVIGSQDFGLFIEGRPLDDSRTLLGSQVRDGSIVQARLT